MSCRNCEEARKNGAVPPCEAKTGEEARPGVNACWIPPLSYEESRILRLHGMLSSIGGLVGPSAVLSAFRATRGDLEVLAMVEAELRTFKKEEGGCAEGT